MFFRNIIFSFGEDDFELFSVHQMEFWAIFKRVVLNFEFFKVVKIFNSCDVSDKIRLYFDYF